MVIDKLGSPEPPLGRVTDWFGRCYSSGRLNAGLDTDKLGSFGSLYKLRPRKFIKIMVYRRGADKLGHLYDAAMAQIRVLTWAKKMVSKFPFFFFCGTKSIYGKHFRAPRTAGACGKQSLRRRKSCLRGPFYLKIKGLDDGRSSSDDQL